jgi:hypothetical protein
MRAKAGDELIVAKSDTGAARVGTIVAVKDSDGSPPYLVHWVVGDYDALVFPRPGVRIKHKAGRGGCRDASSPTGPARRSDGRHGCADSRPPAPAVVSRPSEQASSHRDRTAREPENSTRAGCG